MTKLKPCPFCNGEDLQVLGFIGDNPTAEVFCNGCRAMGPSGLTETEADWEWGQLHGENPAKPAAIRKWNDRFLDPEPRAYMCLCCKKIHTTKINGDLCCGGGSYPLI